MHEFSIKLLIALVVSVGVSGIYLAFNSYKKRRRKIADIDLTAYPWKPVGTIKSLWIFPITSCRGISIPKFSSGKEGPMVGYFRDRSFVIVNRLNNMVTAKNDSSLLKIIPIMKHEEGSLVLTYENTDSLILNIQIIEALGEPTVVQIGDNPIAGVDCGEDVSDWLSEKIGIGHRLIYHRDRYSKRLIPDEQGFHYMMKNDSGIYSDLFGYLLTTTSSLKDICARAGEDFPCENFRPNILVENETAYEEDRWTFLEIGGVHFRNARCCDRLGKDDHPLFSTYLTTSQMEQGEVSVGDIIYASTCPRIDK